MTAVVVRPLTAADADACDRIVLGLPYHFAHEGGRADRAAAVRRDRGLVAVEGSDVVVLTFAPRFDEAAEITWMAVRADRRRRGIGHALIASLEDVLASEGRRTLVVLTVSPSDPGDEPPDGYQSTRAFYRSAGSVLARDLPRGWESDTAVLLVRSLPA